MDKHTNLSGRHPEPVHAVLHVGVTGHRPEKLDSADWDELQSAVEQLLARIMSLATSAATEARPAYSEQGPTFRVISALAEGADRIVATAALATGYELHVCLPLPRARFEEDFVGSGSREEFRQLLDESTSVLELDDGQTERPDVYSCASQLVIAHSDLLIAIWDGVDLPLKGGTAETVERARRAQVPVIIINARAPHTIRLLESPAVQASDCTDEALQRHLAQVLVPPDRGDQVREYYSERQPSRSAAAIWGSSWRVLASLCALGGLSGRSIELPSESETTDDWESVLSESNSAATWLDRLTEQQRWADLLAVHYGDRYRTTYLYCYLGAAVAAVMGASAAALRTQPLLSVTCGATELVLLSVAVFLIWVGRRRKLHERFIDYRLLAQQLAAIRFLVLIGHSVPRLRGGLQSLGPASSSSWVLWFARAVGREFGVLNATVDAGYLEKYRKTLVSSVLQRQIAYHDRKSAQYHCLNMRLHRVGLLSFYAAMAMAIFHVVPHHMLERSAPFDLGRLVEFFATLLPVVGAACFAIRNHGEYERIELRCRAIKRRLESLAERPWVANGPAPSWPVVSEYSRELADVLISEAIDWRILLHVRMLSEP